MNVFLISLLLAIALISLGVLVASGRKAANLWFAVFLTCAAAWLLVTMVPRLSTFPSESLLLNIYKLAYTLDLMGTTSLLFFSLSLRGGTRTLKRVLLPAFTCDALLSAAIWSGLLIERAYLSAGLIRLELRPLYWGFLAWIILKLTVFLATLIKLRSRSPGMERRRLDCILAGFLGALILIVFGLGLLPALSGLDLPDDWISFMVALPALFTLYAMFRYGLLGIHLTAQRLAPWLLAVALVTVPALGLIFLIRRVAGPGSAEAQAQAALFFLVLTVLLAPSVYRLSDRIATLFLFAGRYRPEELLNRISSRLDDTIEVGRGLRMSLGEACREMGLERLLFVLPREGGKIYRIGYRYDPERGYCQVYEEGEAGHLLHLPRPLPPLWYRDRSFAHGGEEEVWIRMEEEGIEAFFPCHSSTGWMGNLLAGKRIGGSSLRMVDIDLLEQLASILAVFIETRTLTTRLMHKLEELRSFMRGLAGKTRLRHDAALIVSHELRTPLTSVVGFAHLLKESYERLNQEGVDECLASIEENVARLERILSILEEVNRLMEGRVNLRRERVGLEDLFLRVRMLLSRAENERVDYRLPADEAELFTDPYLLLLILRNLLSNALRFSPAESRVVFEAVSRKSRVEFRVSDRGPGIRPELLEEAFQPFTRLVDVNKHGAGTGLGLYAARLAAELLGTSIEVNTTVGEGSVFFFSLPALQGLPA